MNKLEQAARALLAKWDAHPYTPWREVGFISGDVANLREALAEPQVDWKEEALRLGGLNAKHVGELRKLKAEQAEQEPFKMICPRCKVDRVTTPCPRGGVSDCPMTATAQNAAPVKTICYQEVYDALEAQLIKEPTGNGLDQLAQNNGLVMAMNTIQKMNLAEQAEQRSDSERMEPVAYDLTTREGCTALAIEKGFERRKLHNSDVEYLVCNDTILRSFVRFALAAPHPVQQEPVAFMFKVKRTTKSITVLDEFAAIDYFPQDNEEIVSKEPLSYAAPVERQWVDLTDEEQIEIEGSDEVEGEDYNSGYTAYNPYAIMDLAIAKFKEKNK